MLDKVITVPMKETVDDFFLGIGCLYCVVDKDQKSVGRFHDFHEAVDKAGKWANYYPNEAPFSIEKMEKLWFTIGLYEYCLRQKERERTDVSSKSLL
jgi:hypothetical protein